MTELQGMFKSLMLLILVLGLMGAAAYTVGLVEHWNRDKLEPEVYGLAKLYAEDPDYTMPIYMWQGKAAGEPEKISNEISNSGDRLGNSTSFALRMLLPAVTVDSVDWTRYNAEKYMYPYYATPTFTVINRTGGEVFAVYEYEGYGHLIYSSDVTRRPVEYEGFLQDQWLKFFTGIENCTALGSFMTSRFDVYTNRMGQVSTGGLSFTALNPALETGEEVSTVMIHVGINPFRSLYGAPDGSGRPEVPAEAVDYAEYPNMVEYESFHTLYPQADDCMGGVGRYTVTSYLKIYAMDPKDADDVIVSSEIRLVHYTPWMTNSKLLFDGWNQDSLSEEQKAVLKQMNVPSHWGCEVTMAEYEEELRIVE